jgi:hypothetical protein
MQIAPDSHLSFHSAGSRLEFPNPFADQDKSTQNSFAPTFQRSAQSPNNCTDSLASRLSQYSTPPTNPFTPSNSLAPLGAHRKRPTDSWPVSTRDSKVCRDDTHTSARPATTAVTPVDTVMAPIMRAKAKAEAGLRSSDDEQPESYDAESPAATIPRERPSEISKVTARTRVNDFGQPRTRRTRRVSQCWGNSQNSASPSSMHLATPNRVHLLEREMEATRNIEVHNQRYREAMDKYESGLEEIPREERRKHALRKLCF